MKKYWAGFLCGIIATLIMFSLAGVAAAKVGSQWVEVVYDNIKVTLDGKQVNLVNANGNSVDPFTINGTTYLPVRAISSALGLSVDWEKTTNTVVLTSPSVGNAPVSGNKDGTVSYDITYQDCKVYSVYGYTYYSAIVEIENTGTADIYLKGAEFNFEDKSGHLLETYPLVGSDPDIIAPGEKGYFYSTGSLKNMNESTDYVFAPVLKVEKSKNSIIRYEIFDTSKTNTSYGGITIAGRIKNNTLEDDSFVQVVCVLYRADGTPITVSSTFVSDLKAGGTASFSDTIFDISDLGINASEVASYKVFASKPQFQF